MEFCQKTYEDCFSYLPEEATKSFFHRLEKQTFQAGEKLSPLFCFIVSGSLDIRREVESGGICRSHTLARIGEGSFVGEGALLGSSDSYCTIVAVEKTSAVVLSKEQFDGFMAEQPLAACLFLKKILSSVHQRLGNSSARLVHVL